MKKLILIIAILYCIALAFNAAAADKVDMSKLTVLKQYKGDNLSQMNLSWYTAAQDFGIEALNIGEAVKFTSPRLGWKLKAVQIAGLVPYNKTSKRFPPDLTFLIEIRDKDLNLLYKYNDIQNIYFASTQGPVLKTIWIPVISITGDFYVIFYDRGSMLVGRTLEKATGSSYFFANDALLPAEFKSSKTNQTVKADWVIKAVGE